MHRVALASLDVPVERVVRDVGLRPDEPLDRHWPLPRVKVGLLQGLGVTTLRPPESVYVRASG